MGSAHSTDGLDSITYNITHNKPSQDQIDKLDLFLHLVNQHEQDQLILLVNDLVFKYHFGISDIDYIINDLRHKETCSQVHVHFEKDNKRFSIETINAVGESFCINYHNGDRLETWTKCEEGLKDLINHGMLSRIHEKRPNQHF